MPAIMHPPTMASDSLEAIAAVPEVPAKPLVALPSELQPLAHPHVATTFTLEAVAPPFPAVPLEKPTPATVAEALALEARAPALLPLAELMEPATPVLQCLSSSPVVNEWTPIGIDRALRRERRRTQESGEGDDEIPPVLMIHLLTVPRVARSSVQEIAARSALRHDLETSAGRIC
jgi:hypothetical protein